ncbi:MAG: TIGR04283 family arsenosugar biosynthesis glycosyltransferase [Alphaproteobacteria bacterium]|nr:TIGR04283 family arsenosugar biosynthesis glycosyltransferase [Alphaproteobacteria bacterium]
MTERAEHLKNKSCLSVVIPALNAADTVTETLCALGEPPLLREVIVVDGGSRDDTARAVAERGARVFIAPRGRGPQLRAGAALALGPWLLFLHADCRVERGWAAAAERFIARYGEARAGYFRFGLDDASRSARRLERLVAWRCRVFGLPYGDQGLLIHRSLYDAVGGYAPIPLMEDVDLVRRLGRNRLAPIGAACVASARRYRREGYLRRPLRNLLCLSLYLAGVSPRRLVPLYG